MSDFKRLLIAVEDIREEIADHAMLSTTDEQHQALWRVYNDLNSAHHWIQEALNGQDTDL